MVVFNNYFVGTGTRFTNGGTSYQIISKEGVGNLIITFGQNLGSGTTHHYPNNATTRTQLPTCVI
jgi:hypothetical protein